MTMQGIFESTRRLPVELWDYSLSDGARGLAAAVQRSTRRDASLHLPGIGDCLPVRSARSGIVIALRALGLPPGAQVAVPLYCCPVVFKAIAAAGMRVRFIDVDRDAFCLSAEDLHRKRHECDAVIAVHAFGQVCDMPAIVEAGLPVIEDCALALGSGAHATPAGLFGDIAVFSFRSGKYLSVGEGGALHARDPGVRAKLAALVGTLRAPSMGDEAVHVAKTLVRSALRSRPLWGLVGRQIWSKYSALTEFSAQTPIVDGKIFRADLHLVRRRLLSLSSAIRQQREHAGYYASCLRSEQLRLQVEPAGHTWNRYLYPLLLPARELRDLAARALECQGVSSIAPYKDTARLAAHHFGYAGDCPNAESVADRVLVLPSHFRLRPSDLRRVVEAFNAAVGQPLVQGGASPPLPAVIEGVR